MARTKITLNELRNIIKQTIKKEIMLNEDILELKQMSKQLYLFLKKKGFEPKLVNKITKPLGPSGGTVTSSKSSIGGDHGLDAQILVNETEEFVTLAVSSFSVAKILVGGGKDWFDKARNKFGIDASDWFSNPEILKYVDKLGEELVSEIKNKYPNMIYKFERQQGYFYVMHFKFGETKKGGKVNPNQRPNAPKPVSESLRLRNIIKQIIKEEYNADQFNKFNDAINKGTPIKAKIKVSGESGVITLTKLKKNGSYKYSGVLSDNGGISSIQVLKGQNVILSNFPNTSEHNYISNTTGKEEIKTNIGMKNGIIFQFIEFV